MKKIFSLIIAIVATLPVLAQPLVESKIYDNLSLTVKGGVTTPLTDPVDHFRSVVGLEFEKMITPVFGIGVEGEWTINTSKSTTVFDHQYVGAYGVTNLMNLFGSYNGSPRFFEVETVLGAGWGHAYNSGSYDENVFVTKTGLNINFNLGKVKEWTLSLKPAVVWNMSKVPCVDDLTYVNYDARRATLQLQAGVTYHFGNTNGTHHFTKCDKVATQAEIDEMNNKINDLRKQMQDDHNYYHDVIRQLNEANYRLSKELQDCNNRPEKVVEVVNMPPVQFMINSAKIQETSQSALKYMADEILSQDVSYIVIGYASEEGESDYNKRLSLKRAEAIRDILVEYGVPADRLIVEGFGETTEFSEEVPALNRVVVIKQHN